MTTKLDDAIAAILAASTKPGCWASRLAGEAAQLVARLREEETKGNKVSRAVARKVLSDAFGVTVSESSVRAHLRGDCACP